MADKNEMINVDTNTGEIVQDRGYNPNNVVYTTDVHKVKRDDKGKYYRNMIYKPYSSIKPQTRQEKIDFMNMLDSEDDSLSLKNHIGKQIEVANIVIRPYDSVDEDNGQTIDGANTFLITPDGVAYVTSSKSVYMKINEYMEYFGTPESEDWENIFLEVYEGPKQEHGKPIKIRMIK